VLVARPVYRRTKAPPVTWTAPSRFDKSPVQTSGDPVLESTTNVTPTPESAADIAPKPETAVDVTPTPEPAVDGVSTAPSSPPIGIGVSAAASSSSVAVALSGIQMPCDLAPLMGVGATSDPTHIVFATEGHRADEVVRRVGDELERIGCKLMSIDAMTMSADRGSSSVEVCVHPDPFAVTDGDELRFPTAPTGSVVVEFRVR